MRAAAETLTVCLAYAAAGFILGYMVFGVAATLFGVPGFVNDVMSWAACFFHSHIYSGC